MDRVSQELSSFVESTQWKDLSAETIQNMKMLTLDSIGCALAGTATEPGKIAMGLAQRLGGPLESSILGTRNKVSIVNAAFANGQLINAIDYDALVMPGAHLPPYIIGSTLAAAESKGVSGQEFLLATALGFELAGRISGALPRGSKFEEPEKTELVWADRWGQAASNFGAAAGVGKLLKLNYNQMLNCLGLAGHLCQVQTWVKYSFSEHRSMAKYGMPGCQNSGGVMAALLAEMGYTGDTTVLDDQEGFWKFVGYSEWHPESILKNLGRDWVNGIIFKPYPCCRMFQTELDCFLKIIKENQLRPEEIEHVTIMGHPTLDAPCFTNREINSISDIQFGPAYIFSMAVNNIPKGVEWQDLDLARSPAISGFSEKVSFGGYPEYGKTLVSKVEVLAREQIFREEKPASNLHRLSKEELLDKYRHNSSSILTVEKTEESIKLILELENVEDISRLIEAITPERK
jgi:2-methylcitrate dehydratase PrpD